MINFTKFLEQLDLSEIEASLYTTLLDNGPMSVRDLAVLTKMKRTTAYFYIDQLIEKGLVMKLTRGTQKMVTVSQPKESLKYLVEQKAQTAQTLMHEFPDMLKAISTTLPKIETNEDAEMKYFKGIENARKIYLEALKANELRAYARIDKSEQLFPDNAAVFKKAFVDNPRLKVWEIIYDSESSTEPSEQVDEYTHRYFYKYMPNQLKLSSEDILIYDGKVAIINFRGGKTSIVLHSQDFFNNLKELFDFMWQTFSEPGKKG